MKLTEVYNLNLPYSVETKADRIVTVPTSALGTLRRELIETLGLERTKGFLMRYGWHCGVSDAMKMSGLEWDSVEDFFLAGPQMHVLHGYLTESKIVLNLIDVKSGKLRFDGRWSNSFEAEQHKALIGRSDCPVCYTLVGYASGYLSTVLGKKVIALETECEAMGHDHCFCVCKTVEEWGTEIEKELRYYEENSIIGELDAAFERIRKEKEGLNKVQQVQRILMNELLRESALPSITNEFFRASHLPIVVTDRHANLLAFAGMSQYDSASLTEKIRKTLNEAGNESVTLLNPDTESFVIKGKEESSCILRIPVVLNRKTAGYCVVEYVEAHPQGLDKLLVEQFAVTCSLYLLNEQTRFNTEQRVRGDFLDDMLSNRISREDIYHRAQYIGFQFWAPFFVLSVTSLSSQMTVEQMIEYRSELLKLTSTFVNKHSVNALAGQKDGNVILLVAHNGLETGNEHYRENICGKLLQCYAKMIPQYPLKIGVSTKTDSLENLQQIYNESVSALRVSHSQKPLTYFDSLGIEGVLCQNLESAKRFIQRLLGGLLKVDSEKDMELTKTLYFYLNNGGNVHKTARDMNLSISGLRYRLQRLNEILNCDINVPYTGNQLYSALLLMISLGELDLNLT
ncbi:XylR N-terminal domain-containing protein [Alicyclobacillus fastidiosus]|uniref:XylR N-terminal domain-containing protein n=1 Tax=Alicyclobacillus fastidiosus TaxID=392011 RepID=A0ABV5AC25_9BACL|nr:XylR N-terminal domain-containing protein [Alicyclobacillus fastidiosus]WEH11508.1 XylR N-terminal domain-containing protein [Alicyclobacillus fastidiosus]